MGQWCFGTIEGGNSGGRFLILYERAFSLEKSFEEQNGFFRRGKPIILCKRREAFGHCIAVADNLKEDAKAGVKS